MKGRVAAAVLAGAGSVGLHAAGLALVSPGPSERLGGGAVQVAMIGDGFEDAAAGTIAARSPDATSPVAETARSQAAPAVPLAATPARPARTAETADPAPAQTGASAAAESLPAVLEASEGYGRTTPLRSEPWQIPASPPAAPGAPRTVEAPPSVAAAPRAPLQARRAERAAQAPPSRVVGRAVPLARAPDADTPRPLPRRPAAEPPAATAGNAARTTRTGAPSGQANGDAARAAQEGAAQGASDGHAAARYPQEVNRHLAQLPRPETRMRGAAVVSFTVASGGGLAALDVARSSGDPSFDRLALSHVRRAVPFPQPPPGAQRQFAVTIRGR